MQILGAGFDYFLNPAIQTRGGILVAWQPSAWSVLDTSTRQFSVSAKVRQVPGDHEWWLSLVHGPAKDYNRPAFIEELHALRLVQLGPWVICGDFNMIYRVQDKSNGQLHRRGMGQFHHFINEASLKEVQLEGRLFT
jgi:hypothetical protein